MFRKNISLMIMLVAVMLIAGQVWGDDATVDGRPAPDGRQDPDYSDEPIVGAKFVPCARHLSFTFEWLGTAVDGEPGQLTDDNLFGPGGGAGGGDDDGLLAFRWTPPIPPMGWRVIRLTFLASIDPASFPGAYPLGFFEIVDAWIDFNLDGTFNNGRSRPGSTGEYIGRWRNHPAFWMGPNRIGAIRGWGNTNFVAGTKYPVRLRLTWGPGLIPPDPGVIRRWGEVEDYDVGDIKRIEFEEEEFDGYPPIADGFVPSLTGYGILVLVLLLIASAAFVLYTRRRRIRA